MPVASLDHEDEPGERVLGYPPPVGHAQLLEHHEDDPGRVMLRDCARIEEERPEIGVNSRGLEKYAVFLYTYYFVPMITQKIGYFVTFAIEKREHVTEIVKISFRQNKIARNFRDSNFILSEQGI